jgi:hypothetical protein
MGRQDQRGRYCCGFRQCVWRTLDARFDTRLGGIGDRLRKVEQDVGKKGTIEAHAHGLDAGGTDPLGGPTLYAMAFVLLRLG